MEALIAALQRACSLSPATPALEGLCVKEALHAGNVWALSELWRRPQIRNGAQKPHGRVCALNFALNEIKNLRVGIAS